MRQCRGVEHPGDALTKHLLSPDLLKRFERMGLVYEEGRAAGAPQLSTSLTQEARAGKDVRVEARKGYESMRAKSMKETSKHSNVDRTCSAATLAQSSSSLSLLLNAVDAMSFSNLRAQFARSVKSPWGMGPGRSLACPVRAGTTLPLRASLRGEWEGPGADAPRP